MLLMKMAIKLMREHFNGFKDEIVWFTSAALSPYIKWESIDSLSARAEPISYQAQKLQAYFTLTGKQVIFNKFIRAGHDIREMKRIQNGKNGW